MSVRKDGFDASESLASLSDLVILLCNKGKPSAGNDMRARINTTVLLEGAFFRSPSMSWVTVFPLNVLM